MWTGKANLALPLLGAAALTFTGCDRSPDRTADAGAGNGVAASTPSPTGPSAAAAGGPVSSPASNAVAESAPAPARRSCAAELGAAAAQRLVKVCSNASPATHPPCNAANSCALIEDEIARSCALFDGKGAPMAGCSPAPKSPQAAAAVVQRYYAALDARDFGTAWQQWGDNGPPNQTQATFAAGFAKTRSTSVTIGALVPGDAGAGSLYQPVPVTVDATLLDGSHQRFVGEYIVRRVNDVDGASADQLRWHIGSAKLQKVAPR